jgi:hypothetical protein
LEFLLSLGWPVNISQHAGWTGNVHTSWKGLNHNDNASFGGDETGQPQTAGAEVSSPSSDRSRVDNETHGGSLYNGDNSVLYWSDVTSEIAFVVPTTQSATWNDAAVWDVSNSGGSEHTSQPGQKILQRF